MLRKKRETAEWLEFEIFQECPSVQHGVFLRSSAISREEICRHLSCEMLATSECVHGTEVNVFPSDSSLPSDGVITQAEKVGLVITHADCQALIFYDPVEKVIGCIHAGWRGNVQNIYARAIGKMKQTFGTKPENLLVAVSPSLGPCCGEFIHYQREIPEKFWPFQVKPLYFDLWEIARFQLHEAGILPHHLEIASHCTRCDHHDFHSYRRDKTKERNVTVVSLSDKC